MKKVKFILPLIAFGFAVIGAMASSDGNSDSFAPKIVVRNQQFCTANGTCSNEDMGPNCTTASGTIQLYERLSSASCSVPAKGTYTP